MAEVPNTTASDNLNVKNGNFICGVVEGNLDFIQYKTISKREK